MNFPKFSVPGMSGTPDTTAPTQTPDTAAAGFATAARSKLAGLTSGLALPQIGFGVIPIGIDSTKNTNPPPASTIYPKVADSQNPNYSVDEATLLGAMKFPDTWNTRIKKPPVILVPGTGTYGGSAYQYNFAKCCQNLSSINYMWLNVPGAMADYSPKNAEFVAYAVHYVAGVTGMPVALIAWSQGNLACQWALKYWPLARTLCNNFISISADFHGTLTAYAAPLPAAPSFLNQRYYSTFIRTLRANGGDSAYVPHTSVYASMFDEIVQPQAGSGASAYMKDERGVGVLNVDVQATCPGKPAGFLYGHGSLMFNSVMWALAKDAILNGGPARLDRIDLPTTSMAMWAEGLTITDCIGSVASLSDGIANCLLFPGKLWKEGPMPDYALAEADSLGAEPALSQQEQAVVDQSKKQVLKTGVPAAISPADMAQAITQQLQTGKPAALPTAAT